MTNEELTRTYVPHLRTQFEQGRPILFTGAGFSCAAKNALGENLPVGKGLKEKLWPICFPEAAFDAETSLQDLYQYAVKRHRAALSELLTKTFSVSEDDIPGWYQLFFGLPWARVYTLNIDDLESVAARTFQLPRKLNTVSAVRADAGIGGQPGELDVIHLNGTLADIPDGVTFSVTQYAQRLAGFDPMYRRLTAELLTSPFVFVGTSLDEPPLWQHLEMRRTRGGGRDQRELRPRSYLVTKHLSPARQALLAEFNVVWLPMYGEEFHEQVLNNLGDSIRQGLSYIAAEATFSLKPKAVPDVAEIAVNPLQGSDYLLGQQPIWADVQSGRAVERDDDLELWRMIESKLSLAGVKGALVISGTAGSGKSTALMRAALKLAAQGTSAGWVSPEGDLSPRDIRTSTSVHKEPHVIAIDDADIYGTELTPMVRELSMNPPFPLLLLTIRAGRVDRVINPALLGGVPLEEHSIPMLADSDIDRLVDVLDRENRLGILKGRSRDQQRFLFREQSGGELLVGMIQATSGRKFADKVVEEMTNLQEDGARVYGLVAVATSFRSGLSRQDILIATGDETNSVLNTLDMLLRRHVLRQNGDGSIVARHRVLGEVIRDRLQQSGQLSGTVYGLALLAATQVNARLRRSAKPWRILRAMLNHAFLERSLGLEATRNLYGDLEQLLSWDYHYWLQRGSFEVEFGDLSHAENFLNQAKGLAPDDPYVDTERAYLMFAQALAAPNTDRAVALVEEATASLDSRCHVLTGATFIRFTFWEAKAWHGAAKAFIPIPTVSGT